jgi:hypothetical protein
MHDPTICLNYLMINDNNIHSCFITKNLNISLSLSLSLSLSFLHTHNFYRLKSFLRINEENYPGYN